MITAALKVEQVGDEMVVQLKCEPGPHTRAETAYFQRITMALRALAVEIAGRHPVSEVRRDLPKP